MKTVISMLLALIVIGCGDTQQNQEVKNDRLELVPEPDRDLRIKNENDTLVKPDTIGTVDHHCSAIDFMQLMKRKVQSDFFAQLDSVLAVQYPNNDRDARTFIELTPRLLNQFLKDINKDSLILNGQFEHEYHFGIAPSGYTDPKICKDKISITFFEDDCHFRVTIYNTFLVEPRWCKETNVVYAFTLRDGRVADFWRQTAG